MTETKWLVAAIVLATILAGLGLFLFLLERRIGKAEKRLHELDLLRKNPLKGKP